MSTGRQRRTWTYMPKGLYVAFALSSVTWSKVNPPDSCELLRIRGRLIIHYYPLIFFNLNLLFNWFLKLRSWNKEVKNNLFIIENYYVGRIATFFVGPLPLLDTLTNQVIISPLKLQTNQIEHFCNKLVNFTQFKQQKVYFAHQQNNSFASLTLTSSESMTVLLKLLNDTCNFRTGLILF